MASVKRMTAKLVFFLRYKLRKIGKDVDTRSINKIRDTLNFLNVFHCDQAQLEAKQVLKFFLIDSASQKSIIGSFLTFKSKSNFLTLNSYSHCHSIKSEIHS